MNHRNTEKTMARYLGSSVLGLALLAVGCGGSAAVGGEGAVAPEQRSGLKTSTGVHVSKEAAKFFGDGLPWHARKLFVFNVHRRRR